MFVSSLATLLVTLPEVCRHGAIVVTPTLDLVMERHRDLVEHTVIELRSQNKYLCLIVSSPRGFTPTMNALMLRYRVPVMYIHDVSENEYALVDREILAARTGKVNVARLLRRLEELARLRERLYFTVEDVKREAAAILEKSRHLVRELVESIKRRDFGTIIRVLTDIKYSSGALLELSSLLMPLREDKATQHIEEILRLFDTIRARLDQAERTVLENIVASISADLADLENIGDSLSETLVRVGAEFTDMICELLQDIELDVHRSVTLALREALRRLRGLVEE